MKILSIILMVIIVSCVLVSPADSRGEDKINRDTIFPNDPTIDELKNAPKFDGINIDSKEYVKKHGKFRAPPGPSRKEMSSTDGLFPTEQPAEGFQNFGVYIWDAPAPSTGYAGVWGCLSYSTTQNMPLDHLLYAPNLMAPNDSSLEVLFYYWNWNGAITDRFLAIWDHATDKFVFRLPIDATFIDKYSLNYMYKPGYTNPAVKGKPYVSLMVAGDSSYTAVYIYDVKKRGWISLFWSPSRQTTHAYGWNIFEAKFSDYVPLTTSIFTAMIRQHVEGQGWILLNNTTMSSKLDVNVSPSYKKTWIYENYFWVIQ